VVSHLETFRHLGIQGDNYYLLLIFYVKRHENKQTNPHDLTLGLEQLSTSYIFKGCLAWRCRDFFGGTHIKNMYFLQKNTRTLRGLYR
jgi:hypothetical protein